MKGIVIMLAVAMMSCAMVGCESRVEETTPAVPAPMEDETTQGMEEPATPGATTAPATQVSAAAAAVAENANCAVMPDHKIDPAVTVAHSGKTIGFCCEDCIPKFKAEPAKYVAAMK